MCYVVEMVTFICQCHFALVEVPCYQYATLTVKDWTFWSTSIENLSFVCLALSFLARTLIRGHTPYGHTLSRLIWAHSVQMCCGHTSIDSFFYCCPLDCLSLLGSIVLFDFIMACVPLWTRVQMY